MVGYETLDGWKLLTPSDTADVRAVVPYDEQAGLMVQGAGIVVLVSPDGDTLPWQAGAGAFAPFRMAKVKATGTTATGIYLCRRGR